MGEFSGPLVLREVGYEEWEIVEGFEYLSDSGLAVTVPVGFRTDLASVPQFMRSLVPKIGYWSQPSVIHDVLYCDHRTGANLYAVSRLDADRLLLEGCRDKARIYGVPDKLRRDWNIYHGVRLGGEGNWLTPEEKAAKQEPPPDWFLDQ